MTTSLMTPLDRPPSGIRHTLEAATALWSLLAAAVGLWFLLEPGAYPLGAADPEPGFSLLGALPVRLVAGTVLILGLVGAAAAVMATRPAPARAVRRSLLTVGVAQVVFFGLVVPDIRLLISMGYLCAVFGPFVVVALLVAGARRNPWNLAVLAAVAGAVLLLGAAFDIGLGAMASLGRNLASGVADFAPVMLTIQGSFLGGVLWLCTSARYARRDRPVGALAQPAAPGRWTWWVTFGAALCPLPYALVRLTWLTPWPQFAPYGMVPEMRVFGLSLGLAALGGSVLTLGLVSGWGERFPRWLPLLGARPVPVLPPTAVALVVAAALTIAGRSLVQQLALAGRGFGELGAEALLVFPFPVWGPLLAAAAVGYYLRRVGRLSRSR